MDHSVGWRWGLLYYRKRRWENKNSSFQEKIKPSPNWPMDGISYKNFNYFALGFESGRGGIFHFTFNERIDKSSECLLISEGKPYICSYLPACISFLGLTNTTDLALTAEMYFFFFMTLEATRQRSRCQSWFLFSLQKTILSWCCHIVFVPYTCFPGASLGVLISS